MAKLSLKAGAAVTDITPPLGVGLLTSAVRETWAPFLSLRSRLKARVIVLEFGNEQVAIVALDMLALSGLALGGWERFKETLARKVSSVFPADHIILTCTHTHNAPESGAITGLYHDPGFKAWVEDLEVSVAGAIVQAVGRTSPCTVTTSSKELHGYSLQRRIPTSAGIVMSDSVQPISPELLKCGPIDHRVRGVFFRRLDGSSIATVIHASCHPVHEMCLPQISADFPGELCRALEAEAAYGVPIFLNGAAGDINPTTVSVGANAARSHGLALARTVSSHRNCEQQVEPSKFAFRSRTFEMATRAIPGDGINKPCTARLNALRMGSLAVLFIPGEIFTAIALAIEKDSPFEQAIIVGFSEETIGYVPTSQAFTEGGYEIGPGKWSFLCQEAESMIRAEAGKLLRDLMDNTIEPSRNVHGPEAGPAARCPVQAV